MTTRAPSSLYIIYRGLEERYGTTAVKRGGIVGDLAHAARGGFHISRQDQPSTNYSVYHSFNKQGPSDLAAAIDITLTEELMVRLSSRLRKAVDARDPRVKAVVFEWFGTLNNSTVTGDLLYSTANRDAGRTSSDSSHLWHIHISFRRDRVTNEDLIEGVLDVLLGKPLSDDYVLQKEFDVATLNELFNSKVIDDPDDPNDDADGMLKISLSQAVRRAIILSRQNKDNIVELEGVVGTIAADVDRAEENSTAVGVKVDAVSTRVNNVSTDLKSLSGRVDTLAQTVLGLNSKLDAILEAVKEPEVEAPQV